MPSLFNITQAGSGSFIIIIIIMQFYSTTIPFVNRKRQGQLKGQEATGFGENVDVISTNTATNSSAALIMGRGIPPHLRS